MTWIVTPEWTPLLIAIYTGIFFIVIGSGYAERKGLMTVKYSKFRPGTGISSRTGMFIIYFLPFLFHIPAVMYFVKEPLTQVQMIFSAAILLHFAKRCYEVLFIHKYSGPIDVSTVIQITSGYSFVSVYAAYLFQWALAEIDFLHIAGVLLFVIGQSGNFYHHKLLANLRESETGYFIPRGGLFEQVACPHYFFEVIAWVGIALISRHVDMFLLALMMGNYLSGRSVKVRDWYLEKFPDYPQQRKVIFPYLY